MEHDSPNPASIDHDASADLVGDQAVASTGPQEAPDIVDEGDAAFILRTFGVSPAKYVRDGVLDRALLDHDVESYRTLFANRVTQGRYL